MRETGEGKFDGTAIWSKSEERSKSFAYSDALLTDVRNFWHLTDYKLSWNNYDDLKSIPMGWLLGYQYEEKLLSYKKEGKFKKVSEVRDLKQGIGMLLKGRIKILASAHTVMRETLITEFSKEQRAKLTRHPKPISVLNAYLLFSKTKRNVRLIEKFNTGLRELKTELGTDWVESPCAQTKEKADAIGNVEVRNLVTTLCRY